MKFRIGTVLAISIVLNLLLAGALMGHVSYHYIAPKQLHAANAFDLQSHLAKLPGDKQALYTNIMGQAKKHMDDERAAIDAMKKQALDILKTEPFNEAAYLQQTQTIYERLKQMKLHVAQSVADLSKQLTAEERAVLADIISHPPFSTPPGWKQEPTAAVTTKEP
ncbi:MAG: periplasmic heavy metal sensor [Candidatus Sungbacteria bacterium]|uniref:Periplasmic heavy metal sensor n=1 Tax=Candidatus Sungiibacteriota bacterium TaxID=2750080 RepID=A0A932R0A9_9BACT|nr:periplasmic heavy metal sensor [Candidatus Sungbacteria bacterium]